MIDPFAELLPRLLTTRSATVALVDGLSAEDCALQSMPDASPLKWHLAHTTWFWETFVLGPAEPGYEPFDPAFRYLFNSYYNGIGAQFPRPSRGLVSRPSLETVIAYRRHVDDALRRLLDGGAPRLRADAASWSATVALGINHEEQHQELMLTDLKHLWSFNPLSPALDGAPPPNPPCAPLGWRTFAGGLVDIGHDGIGFGFDNESPRHRAWLEPFAIADRPVSNREYLAFIDAGGYDDPGLWLSEGFDRAASEGWRSPAYWRRVDGAWREYTLHGERPLDPDAPACHLSYYEADAYARFAGARLPTEVEWEHAAAAAPLTGQFARAGERHPRMPLPDEPMFGGLWTWTSSSYAPYPGFRASGDAIGEYNGKFMVNQYVLRGGSCATPPGHVRASYRNFFPTGARWQFSGIRLARDIG